MPFTPASSDYQLPDSFSAQDRNPTMMLPTEKSPKREERIWDTILMVLKEP